MDSLNNSPKTDSPSASSGSPKASGYKAALLIPKLPNASPQKASEPAKGSSPRSSPPVSPANLIGRVNSPGQGAHSGSPMRGHPMPPAIPPGATPPSQKKRTVMVSPCNRYLVASSPKGPQDMADRVAVMWKEQPPLGELVQGHVSLNEVFDDHFFRLACEYYDTEARKGHNLQAPFEFHTCFSASSFSKMCSFNSFLLSLGVSSEPWAKELLDYFDSKVQAGLSEEHFRILVADKFLPVVEKAMEELAPELLKQFKEDVKDLILKRDERSGDLRYMHLGPSLLFAVALAAKVPVIVLSEELKGSNNGMANLMRVQLYGDMNGAVSPLIFLNSMAHFNLVFTEVPIDIRRVPNLNGMELFALPAVVGRRLQVKVIVDEGLDLMCVEHVKDLGSLSSPSLGIFKATDASDGLKRLAHDLMEEVMAESLICLPATVAQTQVVETPVDEHTSEFLNLCLNGPSAEDELINSGTPITQGHLYALFRYFKVSQLKSFDAPPPPIGPTPPSPSLPTTPSLAPPPPLPLPLPPYLAEGGAALPTAPSFAPPPPLPLPTPPYLVEGGAALPTAPSFAPPPPLPLPTPPYLAEGGAALSTAPYLAPPPPLPLPTPPYLARSCIMLVLPTFGPLPQKPVLCNLLGQVKVLLSRRSSLKAIVASKVISAIEMKNRLASHEYFTRIWTLAERMARFGREERLCNWLSLESWLGMLLDALFRRTANVYSKILGPSSRRLINAATTLIQDAVNTNAIHDPKVIEHVADLLELAVTTWLPSNLPSVVEAPTTDWLRVYLGKESVSGIYNAFKQEDRVWAIYTYFIWGEVTDIRTALEALVCLVDDDVEAEEEVRNEGMFVQLGLTDDKEGRSPLHRAAIKGRTETVRSLLGSLSADKKELDQKDKNGHTPLHLASGQGNVEVAALLLDAGADKEARGDEDGYSPLMMSCSSGKVEVFNLLIEKGADVNARSGTNGATALIRAADFGHEVIVQSLLANGAKAFIRGKDGKMAFDVAKSQSLQVILNMALGSTREERVAKKLELIDKISQGMLADAESLITKGFDVNAKDKDERSPLLVACGKGFEVIAKSLIESGADVNTKDKFGYTAFDWACVRGHRSIIRLLHLAMTNLETLDDNDKVDAAIATTLIKIVDAAKTKYGDRPLVTAARAVDEEAVKALIASGYKDLEERDKDGRTPLLNTAAFGMESSLKALLVAGANINAQSNWGRTALIIAADLGQEVCVRLLLERGADKSIADTTNKTALGYASTESIKAILGE